VAQQQQKLGIHGIVVQRANELSRLLRMPRYDGRTAMPPRRRVSEFDTIGPPGGTGGSCSVAAAILDPPGLLWTRSDGGHVDKHSSLSFLLQPALTEGHEWTDNPSPTPLHPFMV